jgi:hypothetical protein
MNAADFLQLPPAARAMFVILIWPALWAAASLIVALAGDLLREKRSSRRPSWRHVPINPGATPRT